MKTYLKKNKALFILPLALIPFVILIFYVLGGGENVKEEKESLNAIQAQGANYLLPEADGSIEIVDKLEAYQQQGINTTTSELDLWETDSVNTENQDNEDSTAIELSRLAEQNHQLPENLLAHIKNKEKALRKELQEPPQKRETRKVKPQNTEYKYKAGSSSQKTVAQGTGIDELDKVFDENKELNRQNDSLTFFLEQAQQQLAEIEDKQKHSFSPDKKQPSGFSSFEGKNTPVKAEVYETTSVLNGTRVKLRLLADTWIKGTKIPRNSFVYGICKIRNERLHIQITQLPAGSSFVPVDLTICDLDGMPGLYVPDNAARKVLTEVGSSTNTSSMFGVSTNPLTYAGIRAADRAAQSILKSTRLKKVTVKKNTLVYITNQKQ